MSGPEKKLCTRGAVTHGHYKENGNYGGPAGDWTMKRGQPTTEVGIADFLYEPGDLVDGLTGVPTVKLGSILFTNLEGASIYHTITSCKFFAWGRPAAFCRPTARRRRGARSTSTLPNWASVSRRSARRSRSWTTSSPSRRRRATSLERR